MVVFNLLKRFFITCYTLPNLKGLKMKKILEFCLFLLSVLFSTKKRHVVQVPKFNNLLCCYHIEMYNFPQKI